MCICMYSSPCHLVHYFLFYLKVRPPPLGTTGHYGWPAASDPYMWTSREHVPHQGSSTRTQSRAMPSSKLPIRPADKWRANTSTESHPFSPLPAVEAMPSLNSSPSGSQPFPFSLCHELCQSVTNFRPLEWWMQRLRPRERWTATSIGQYVVVTMYFRYSIFLRRTRLILLRSYHITLYIFSPFCKRVAVI